MELGAKIRAILDRTTIVEVHFLLMMPSEAIEQSTLRLLPCADGHCAKIESSRPEKMKPDATNCSVIGDQTLCVTYDLGEYPATRKGNFLTIEAPNGKLKF